MGIPRNAKKSILSHPLVRYLLPVRALVYRVFTVHSFHPLSRPQANLSNHLFRVLLLVHWFLHWYVLQPIYLPDSPCHLIYRGQTLSPVGPVNRLLTVYQFKIPGAHTSISQLYSRPMLTVMLNSLWSLSLDA